MNASNNFEDIITSQHLKPIVDIFLADFKAHPHDVLRSRLILGPDNSFIAITPHTTRWHGLDTPSPRRLLGDRGYATDGSGKPKEGWEIVDAALGYRGAWWIRFANGTCNWDFNGGYEELDQLLNSGHVKSDTINVRSSNL